MAKPNSKPNTQPRPDNYRPLEGDGSARYIKETVRARFVLKDGIAYRVRDDRPIKTQYAWVHGYSIAVDEVVHLLTPRPPPVGYKKVGGWQRKPLQQAFMLNDAGELLYRATGEIAVPERHPAGTYVRYAGRLLDYDVVKSIVRALPNRPTRYRPLDEIMQTRCRRSFRIDATKTKLLHALPTQRRHQWRGIVDCAPGEEITGCVSFGRRYFNSHGGAMLDYEDVVAMLAADGDKYVFTKPVPAVPALVARANAILAQGRDDAHEDAADCLLALAHHLSVQQQDEAATAVPDTTLRAVPALFSYIERHYGLTVTPPQRYYVPLLAALSEPKRTTAQWVQWLKAKVGVT